MSRAGGDPSGGAPGAPPGTSLGAALLVALAACAFGSISTLTVVATRGAAGRPGPSLATVLFWRYLLAAAVLVPLARPFGARGGAPNEPAWRPALLGGLGQAAVAFVTLSALRWITVGALGFLFYTYPAWVLVIAALRGSERLEGRRVAALGLSLCGIACTIGVPSGIAAAGVPAGGAWPGVVLALGGALVYAAYIPYLGAVQARWTPVRASALVCVGAAALFAPAAAAGGGPLVALPAASWGALGVLALACTVLAFVAFLRGLDALGSVRTAIVSTVEPFFTALLGAAVLGQRLGAATVAGGVLIAAAVLLIQLPAAGRATPEPA